MKIKLSKSQWEKIGKKAGWMKTAYESEESREWVKMVNDQMQSINPYTRGLVGLYHGDELYINRMEEVSLRGKTPQQILDERNAELAERNQKIEAEGGKKFQWRWLGEGSTETLDGIMDNYRKWRREDMGKKAGRMKTASKNVEAALSGSDHVSPIIGDLGADDLIKRISDLVK